MGQNGIIIVGVIVVIIVIGAVWLYTWGEKQNKKKSEEDRIRRYNELVKNAKDKFARLSAKYGDETALKLVNAEYFIGMTREQLIDSKGSQPDSAEVQQLKTKSKETLVWGNKNSGDWFVLEEGVVVKITDRPDYNTPVKLSLNEVKG